MIKRCFFISILSVMSFTGLVNAQCVPNFIFTSLGVPGVYPPELPVPNIPMVGLMDGQINTVYSETLTLVVLEDTSLDVGFLLPAAVVTAMNAAGISTVMTVDVNHVIFDVQGLPNGLNFTCDQNMCQYSSGIDGCIAINGTPTQAGTFSVPVSMSINIQIPAITVPIIGTVLYAGGSQDIPTFDAVTYDLFIQGLSSIEIKEKQHFSIYPNPTFNQAKINIEGSKHIQVFDALGNKVVENNMINEFVLTKEEIGSGLFFIRIFDENSTSYSKLIIN